MAYTITEGKKVYFRGPSKVVALTFDDGPHAVHTAQVAQVLKSQGDIKATFFCLGGNLTGNEKIVKDLAAAGHVIGNHSTTHPNMEQDLTHIQSEIAITHEALYRILGYYPRVFRSPYGSGHAPTSPSHEIISQLLACMKYDWVGWNIDTLDWKLTDDNGNPIPVNVKKDQIINAVKTQFESANGGNASIILFHDGGGNRQATVDALPTIIQYFKGLGYKFATIPELLHLPHE